MTNSDADAIQWARDTLDTLWDALQDRHLEPESYVWDNLSIEDFRALHLWLELLASTVESSFEMHYPVAWREWETTGLDEAWKTFLAEQKKSSQR